MNNKPTRQNANKQKGKQQNKQTPTPQKEHAKCYNSFGFVGRLLRAPNKEL